MRVSPCIHGTACFRQFLVRPVVSRPANHPQHYIVTDSSDNKCMYMLFVLYRPFHGLYAPMPGVQMGPRLPEDGPASVMCVFAVSRTVMSLNPFIL
jgi:hypothetical protein